MGAKTVEDALTLWADLPPDLQPGTASRWLGRAVRLVMFRRKRSQALALAYYRLARALRTGTTVADPYHPEPSFITLDTLRREFAALAGTEPQVGSPDMIRVETISGLAEALAAIETAAEREANEALTNLGPLNSQKKQTKIDGSSQDSDAQRREAHDAAGRRQAASAERIALNGARSTVQATSTRDAKVIGWVRLSRSGTPCGWCAMLISRGPVYKNAKTAGDVDQYHDNCKCYAEPVYGMEDFDTSPLYSLNREYARLWPQVTKGLGGDAALTAWRYFIRQQAGAQAATG